MIKKVVKWILSLLVIGLIALVIFIFNGEKFLSEYWFQKKIDAFSCIEPLENISITNPTLKYNIYDNSGIDMEIAIRKNGVISISRNVWNSQKENSKVYYFKTNKTITEEIFNEFNQRYSETKVNAVDDHLSARYYRFLKIDTLKTDNIEIAFYNAQPDRDFKRIKKEFLDIGNRVIDELEK